MLPLSSYFLTLASVSAVLAGICVTVRNFSYSIRIDPKSTGLTVGEKDYPEILEKSGWWATIAAIIFLANTLACMVGVAITAQSNIDFGSFPSLLAWGVGVIFSIGVILLGVATVRGFFQTHQPKVEEPAETEPLDEEE